MKDINLDNKIFLITINNFFKITINNNYRETAEDTFGGRMSLWCNG